MARPGGEHHSLTIAFDHRRMKHQEVMRTRGYAPVDTPLQGRKSMVRPVGCKNRLPIDGKTGLRTHPPAQSAQSARASYLDMEIADRFRIQQRIQLVKMMRERCERSEVGANREIEGAKLEALARAGESSGELAATQVTDKH